VAEPVAEPVAEVVKPQVVTRTRRRSASRPAGPPAQVGVTGTLPTSGQVEPGTAVLEPGSGDGAREGGHADAPTVEHVPVKKKGTRKR
jgi:ribonuclease E